MKRGKKTKTLMDSISKVGCKEGNFFPPSSPPYLVGGNEDPSFKMQGYISFGSALWF